VAGKGDRRRRGKGYEDNYDNIFGGSMEDMIYLVETPKEIFWSKRKMDTHAKHIEFLFRDKARYKVQKESLFQRYIRGTDKRVVKLEEEKSSDT
jgi:hypothetical protein